jgi:hypothetical protein
MSYIVKIALSGAPNLTAEERANRAAALITSSGFLGLKVGNPAMTLWSTEAAANAHAASEQADAAISPSILMVDVVTLESEGLTTQDFFDMQTTFPENPNA